MAGSTLVRVNVTHDYGIQKFEQDLKNAVLAAGIDTTHTVFLLKDAQVCFRRSRTHASLILAVFGLSKGNRPGVGNISGTNNGVESPSNSSFSKPRVAADENSVIFHNVEL